MLFKVLLIFVTDVTTIKNMPYFILTGRKPNLSKMWVFGSDCYAYRHDDHKKLDPRCEKKYLWGTARIAQRTWSIIHIQKRCQNTDWQNSLKRTVLNNRHKQLSVESRKTETENLIMRRVLMCHRVRRVQKIRFYVRMTRM